MPKYLVEVVTHWAVEVEAEDAQWASVIAVEQHTPSTENITWEDTYPELVKEEVDA